MQIIIDRFEENFAVVELPDMTMISVPKSLFENAKEGDIFQISKQEEQTKKRKEEMDSMMRNLWVDE